MKCLNCGLDHSNLDRGVALNRITFLASQAITLRDQIVDWEKQARKTPPKTLKSEVAKVKQAKIAVEEGKTRLTSIMEEMGKLAPIADWWAPLLGPDPRRKE